MNKQELKYSIKTKQIYMTTIKEQMEICAYLKCGVVCGGVGFGKLVMFLFNYSRHKYIYICRFIKKLF